MIETAISKPSRGLGAVALLLLACAGPAAAQFGPPPASVPGSAPRNQTCLRLESQLAGIDRGTVDPARAEQIRRYEEVIGKQQGELDRLGQQAQRMGCSGGGFFALFSGQPAQCGQLNNQIQQIRANLDRLMGDLQQYATAPGGFFETLFGIRTPFGTAPDAPLSGSGAYRTVCVRTCDGYYFPISYSTVPTKFYEDERLCQRLCPASEVALYSHRNPGEDVTQAVSSSGRSYSELPNAFSYRKQYNPACSCRAPGQSWAEALRQLDDHTLERGDIVVTEEQAKALSQPRTDAQGKPIKLEANPARNAPGARNAAAAAPKSAAAAPNPAPPAAASPPPPEDPPEEDRAKRKVRSVGPAFYPTR